MFAEQADSVWMNPTARSGKFRTNSTAVDTGCGEFLSPSSPQAVDNHGEVRCGVQRRAVDEKSRNCCDGTPGTTLA